MNVKCNAHHRITLPEAVQLPGRSNPAIKEQKPCVATVTKPDLKVVSVTAGAGSSAHRLACNVFRCRSSQFSATTPLVRGK